MSAKAKPAKKPKVGLYVEVVMHGHGAHEIIGAWDVPIHRVEELQQVIEGRPDLFTERDMSR